MRRPFHAGWVLQIDIEALGFDLYDEMVQVMQQELAEEGSLFLGKGGCKHPSITSRGFNAFHIEQRHTFFLAFQDMAQRDGLHLLPLTIVDRELIALVLLEVFKTVLLKAHHYIVNVLFSTGTVEASKAKGEVLLRNIVPQLLDPVREQHVGFGPYRNEVLVQEDLRRR